MHNFNDCPRGVFGCEECTSSCPHCGFVQPNDHAVCDICGGPLADTDPGWDGVTCQNCANGADCTKPATRLLVLDASMPKTAPEPFTLFTCAPCAAGIRYDAREHQTSTILADMAYSPTTYRNTKEN